jgi:hypothetical protein
MVRLHHGALTGASSAREVFHDRLMIGGVKGKVQGIEKKVMGHCN